MTGALEPGADGARPVFEGFPEVKSPAVVVLAPSTQTAPLPTPQQYLQYIYDEDEWEVFTVEWVQALGLWNGRPYLRVQRMGGAGDRGADVAACLTLQGTAGEWHCYQCKHYVKPLGQADAFPEMVKIFTAKILGTYELPTRYVFVAPRIGTTLDRLLLNPPQLKEEFFSAWDDADSKLGKKLTPAVRDAVGKLARQTDFSMFSAQDLDEIVRLHATTPHHVRRFPQPLRPRPDADPAPAEQKDNEAVYVRKLLDAYNEKHGLSLETGQQARETNKVKRHFTRQREAFFHAEALRLFARDSVPDATYEAIETDLYDVVIEVEDRDYDLGHDRLDAVIDAAMAHTPNPHNILAPVVKKKDLMGLCHHLANDDRLTWCKEELS
ncbi:ABC-three component system protein [Streptomyces sp. NPDC094143]|uniref:ABC-three component system protein n=1 Tax=Streptomyces sp. NPDC094143 TaxID=3155310 RepID=UPI00331D3F82